MTEKSEERLQTFIPCRIRIRFYAKFIRSGDLIQVSLILILSKHVQKCNIFQSPQSQRVIQPGLIQSDFNYGVLDPIQSYKVFYRSPDPR